MSEVRTGEEILAAGIEDWRLMLRRLHARYEFDDYATGLALLADIGAYADRVDHHPDLTLRYRDLRVVTSSHDLGDVTQRDIDLAREISVLAARHGARAVPDGLQILEVALDSPDFSRIAPFWRALLGAEPVHAGAVESDEVIDPTGAVAPLWFQECGPDDGAEARMRFHLDITVPHDQALARVEAALGAGGTLVTAQYARAFWVLADADGNKACICTWQDRG